MSYHQKTNISIFSKVALVFVDSNYITILLVTNTLLSIYRYGKTVYKHGEIMKQITLQLNEKTIREAKTIAEIEQIPYTVMFRNWIAQRIREYAPVKACKQETGASQ